MDLDLKRNLSNTDRVIRAIIGLLLLGLVYTKTVSGWWSIAAIVIALFQFVEAALAY